MRAHGDIGRRLQPKSVSGGESLRRRVAQDRHKAWPNERSCYNTDEEEKERLKLMKTGGGFKMKNIAHRTSGLGLLVLLMLGATSASQAQIILDRKVGEIFVAIGGGQYQVWDFSNTPTVETITNGAGSNAGCAFDSMYHPFTTSVTANDVFRDMIDNPQNVLQTINVPANGGAPKSIAFDGAGNFYAGQAGGNGLIEEYSPGPSGTFSFVQTLPVNTKTLKGGSA